MWQIILWATLSPIFIARRDKNRVMYNGSQQVIMFAYIQNQPGACILFLESITGGPSHSSLEEQYELA